MQKNKLLYISVGVLLAALLIFIISYMGIGFKFNTTVHAEWEQDGTFFTYKGSSKEIRKLEISREGKELLELELSALPSLFPDEASRSAIVVDSEYENSIILFPYSLDDDGDKHYRTLCLNSDGSASFDIDTDIINPKLENDTGNVLCESVSRTLIGKTQNDIDAPYEEATTMTVYRANEEKLFAIYQISVTYYSENNIYCVSSNVFDAELGGLGNSADDWLSPEEYKNAYDALDESFDLPLPQKHS